MAGSPVRTIVIVAVIVGLALVLRWGAGDWLMLRLRSLHG
jgi:hypothetical protein